MVEHPAIGRPPLIRFWLGGYSGGGIQGNNGDRLALLRDECGFRGDGGEAGLHEGSRIPGRLGGPRLRLDPLIRMF